MSGELAGMIRIVVRTDDEAGPLHTGAPARSTLRTFDVSAPELVAFINQYEGLKGYEYLSRTIVGVEVLALSAATGGGGESSG